jgi:hypothetical protein
MDEGFLKGEPMEELKVTDARGGGVSMSQQSIRLGE